MIFFILEWNRYENNFDILQSCWHNIVGITNYCYSKCDESNHFYLNWNCDTVSVAFSFIHISILPQKVTSPYVILFYFIFNTTPHVHHPFIKSQHHPIFPPILIQITKWRFRQRLIHKCSQSNTSSITFYIHSQTYLIMVGHY